MSDRFAEITREALSLPSNERMDMAILLFDSLKDQNCEADGEAPIDLDLVAEIRRRNRAYDSGIVDCRTHEEVMASVRAANASK